MSNRHTIIRLSFSAIIAIVGLSVSMLTYAASGDTVQESEPEEITGFGNLTIEQKNPFNGTLGGWTLVKAGSGSEKGTAETVTLNNLEAGSYTLFVNPPNGTITSVRTYHGTEQLEYLIRPQISFKLSDGESLRIAIHYILTRTGVIAIQSDPPGLEYTLKGPDGFLQTGKTPSSVEVAPEGQYSIQYGTLDGCTTPKPKSDQLKSNGRISFNFNLVCESADKLRSRQNKKGEQFVVILIGGNEVTLRDVPQNIWFSKYVYNAARRNVLSGYKDDAGNPSGMFGPENNVTVAELAKIAHRIGGISEESSAGHIPDNPLAANQWFTPFIASAEGRGWTIYKDATIDPLRPATRAEVIATFLQVLDIPLRWQKGTMFSDVTLRTRYANAIETAAEDKIIAGRTDEKGNPLHLFAPEDPINRAEISKIINSIFDIYKGDELLKPAAQVRKK